MQLTLVQLSRFALRWAQHKLTDDDLRALERMLLSNPNAGAVVGRNWRASKAAIRSAVAACWKTRRFSR